MKERSYAAPVVAVLILLPLFYVGLYAGLVRPEGEFSRDGLAQEYVCGNQIAIVFWPLEQIDRRLRPKAWMRLRFLPAPRVSLGG